jgi:TAP-like protein
VDGVLDPVAWSTGRGDQARTLPFSTRLGSAKGAYQTLQEFLRLCDAGGPNCAFSEGDPKRRFDRLARRLLREPVEFTDPASGETFLVTYAELIGATLGVLYDPAIWPEWAGILQQLWELTDPEAAAASLRTLRAGRAQDRRFPYFGRPWTWNSSMCEPWRGWDRTTANPVLVVGNRFDPATPYHGAVTVDRLLPRSRLLTLDGWGHTSMFLSSCVDAHVNTYLLTIACRPGAPCVSPTWCRSPSRPRPPRPCRRAGPARPP